MEVHEGFASAVQFAVTVFATFVFCWCALRAFRLIRFLKRVHALPAPEPSRWLLGHLAAIGQRRNVRGRRLKWRTACPSLYRLDITRFIPLVSLVRADLAAKLLRSSEPKMEYFYSLLRPWLGDGLLLSRGRKWARDRRLLTHCFHFDILRSYMEVYNDAVGIMLQKWTEACQNGESVDVSDSCTLLTLDIILRCAMGFESNCQVEADPGTSQAAMYAQTVKRITQLLEMRGVTIWHHPDIIYYLTQNGRDFRRSLCTLHEMSRHLISERRAAPEHDDAAEVSEGHRNYRDFLDVLLTVKDEDGKGLTDEEIREQVDTFLFRGHDTTASALQWIVYYLSQHEELQAKCRAEVLGVLEKSGNESHPIEHEDLQELTYTTQFIKESMRLSCPVPFILRELTQETKFGQHYFPSGTPMTVSLLDCHNNEQDWESPDVFDPDRFSSEKSEGRHPFAFIPFSAGPRNCIGQTLAMDELKTATVSIVRHFKVVPDPCQPPPVWRSQLVARSENGIKVRLLHVDAQDA